jgi:hypothetical protein
MEVYLISLSWSVHCNLVRDYKNGERGWVYTTPLTSLGLFFHYVATLCVLCVLSNAVYVLHVVGNKDDLFCASLDSL